MQNDKRDAQQSYIVEDGSRDRAYFVMVPHLVHDVCRSAYDLALWFVIKMVAGEDRECTLSTEQLAALSMMSVGKVISCRKFLLDAGLIEGRIKRDPGYVQAVWHLKIPDLWPANIAWRKEHNELGDRIERKRAQRSAGKASLDEGLGKASLDEGMGSPDEGMGSPDEGKRSRGDHKEYPCSRTILEPNENARAVWEQARAWLAANLAASQYATWLEPAQLVAFARGDPGAEVVLDVRDPFSAAWVENRLDPVIRRSIAGVLGVGEDTIHVSYHYG